MQNHFSSWFSFIQKIRNLFKLDFVYFTYLFLHAYIRKIRVLTKSGGVGVGESERHSHFLALALPDVYFYLTFFYKHFFLRTLFFTPTSRIFHHLGGGTGNAGMGWGDSECRSYWSLEDQYSLVKWKWTICFAVDNRPLFLSKNAKM